MRRGRGDHFVIDIKFEAEKERNEGRVELRTGTPLDFGEHLVARHGRAIASGAAHGVESIDKPDDAGGKGDLFAGESVRIPAAVPAFVVVEHTGEHILKRGDIAEDAVPDFGVKLDGVELFVSQASGFAEHFFGDTDFADIVDQPGNVDALDLFSRQAVGLGETSREIGDAFAVAAGVFVFGVDGGGQGLERAHEHRLLLDIEGGVFEERPEAACRGFEGVRVVRTDLGVDAAFFAREEEAGGHGIAQDRLDDDLRAAVGFEARGVADDVPDVGFFHAADQVADGALKFERTHRRLSVEEHPRVDDRREAGVVDKDCGDPGEIQAFVEAVDGALDELLRFVRFVHFTAEGIEQVDGLVGAAELAGELADGVGVFGKASEVGEHPAQKLRGMANASGFELGDGAHRAAGGGRVELAGAADGLKVGRGERLRAEDHGNGVSLDATSACFGEGDQPAAIEEFGGGWIDLAVKVGDRTRNAKGEAAGTKPQPDQPGIGGFFDEHTGGVGSPDGQAERPAAFACKAVGVGP